MKKSMAAKFWRFFMIASMMFASSCERFVPIDPPDHSSSVVLNGLIQADRPWEVYISQSENYFADLGTGEREDATVWIELASGDTVDLPYTLSLTPQIAPPFLAGYQTLSPLPETEQRYTVHADLPGFESVKATMLMPPAPIILAAVWEDSASIDPRGKLISKLSLTLRDPQIGEPNYFFVYAETLTPPITNIEWNSEDPAVRFDMRLAQRDTNNIYSIFQRAQYISDEWFSDSIQTIDFFIPSSRMSFLANFYDGWSLKVACINEPFYRYVEDYIKQREALGNPFAEPSPVYSNIQNGLGIWGGFALDSLSFFW